MSYGFRVDVRGDYALFSRPEMKTERVSYDVMTPSAARGIIEAIYWHPGLKWIIDKIYVLSPIRFTNIRRNEVKAKASARAAKQAMTKKNVDLYLSTKEEIQQRASMVLCKVHYVIEAHFELTDKANASTPILKPLRCPLITIIHEILSNQQKNVGNSGSSQKEPDKYTLTSIPGERSQFYFLNENNISINVRKAINSIVDKEAIAKFLEGSTSASDGPFNPSAAYGKVAAPAKVDLETAKKLMEDDGYTLNGNGIYEKDGKEVNLTVKYYEARELDKVATLMQEQLKAAGINTTLKAEEDTEGYVTTGDYDIALYCMITDKFGDPYYFINNTLADGGYYNAGGFKNEECQKLIDQLKSEEDVAKRADLANQIVQIAVDDAYMGYVGLFNKTTVAKPGITGISADNPYDFYGVYSNTSF